jgi:hypothetical protein
MLSACLCGSLLGFLRYNFNPATIFLGDSGSMFLGFALAATALEGAATKSSTAIAILVPIIALGLPIVDTMLAMVRRTLTRRSIFAADRGHIHHRLLDLGITHRRVVLMLYGLSIALALAAMGIAFGRSWQVGAALVVVGVLVAVIVRPLRLRIQPSKGVRGERLTSLVRADIDTAVDKLRQVSTEVELEWIFAELRGRARIRAHYTPHNGQPERLVQPVSQGNRRSFPVAEGMLDVELDEELQDQLQDLARPLEDLRDACDAAVRRAESARQAAGGDPQTTNHGASVLDPMQRRA